MGLMSSQVDATLGLEESITGLNIIIRTESPGRIPYPPRQVSCLDAPKSLGIWAPELGGLGQNPSSATPGNVILESTNLFITNEN